MKSKLYLIVFLFLISVNLSWAANFFPDKAFSEKQDANDFVVGWYSKHLVALGENSLWENRETKGLFVYRFLSLPTWGSPTAITFRLNDEGTGKLVIKKTDGQGGYEPGKLVLDKTISLDERQTKEILEQFKKLDFWKLPVKDDVMGLDGTQWIIEGVKEGRYHIVDRWTPGSGDFYDTCRLLFRISELEP